MEFTYGKKVSNEFLDDKLDWDKDDFWKKVSWKIGKNAKQKINTKKVLQTNKQLDEFNELARTWDEDLCE